MKKGLLFCLLAIGWFVSAKATTFYTIDIGNGTEWSLDGSTACNCGPADWDPSNVLYINHSISMPSQSFQGEIHVLSGVTTGAGSYLTNGSIYISTGATLEFTGGSGITQNTFVEVNGSFVFNTNNWFSFQNAEMVGSGNLDLTNVSGCGIYNAIVNGKNAANVLFCQQNNDLSLLNVNIWNGSSWSAGQAPSSCAENAILSASYNTSNGSITAGNFSIDPGLTLTIASGSYVDICKKMTSGGTVVVESGGSLVQQESSTLIDNGVFNVKREDKLDAFRYHIWSSPVVGNTQLESIFYNSNPCDMYVFEGQNQVWKYDFVAGHQTICNGNAVVFPASSVIPDGDGVMNTAMGYFIPGASWGPVTREFWGTVHNGEISSRVLTTSLGSNTYWDGDDWNMVGNPYPSGIDGALFWKENAVDNAKLTDGLYFWVAEADTPYHQFQSYLVWNPVGATYIRDGSTPFDGVIPTASGFWVSANDPDGSGNSIYDIKFKNSMRITDGNSLVVSERSFPNISNFERERAWLTVTTASNQYEQILVGQHPFATDGIDRLYDAHYNPSGSPITFASVNENELFTIQGFSPFTQKGSKDLELYIHTSDTTTHYLTWDSTLFFEGNKELFLVDSVEHTITQLPLNQAVELPIDSVGEYKERFYLRVEASDPNSVEDAKKYDFEGRVWSVNKTIFFDNFAVNVEDVNVYNLLGQQVYSGKPNSRNSSFELPINSTGVYFVHLKDSDGRQQVVKLFINS